MSLYSDLAIQLDESGGPVFWVQQQCFDALNEAVLEVSQRLRYALATASLVLTTNDDIVALPTTSIMTPQYILDSQSRKCFATRHARLEEWDQAWQNTQLGPPELIVLWDESHVRVWPRPDTDYTYSVVGVAWPSEITTTSDASMMEKATNATMVMVPRLAGNFPCMTQLCARK